MIDPQTETLIPFSRVPAEVPGRIHRATAHRWRQRGVRGVKLESILIGGRRYTSLEKLSEFFAATTAAADGSPPPARASRQRERAIAEAERTLLDAGI